MSFQKVNDMWSVPSFTKLEKESWTETYCRYNCIQNSFQNLTPHQSFLFVTYFCLIIEVLYFHKIQI